jgi:hypothetical protein
METEMSWRPLSSILLYACERLLFLLVAEAVSLYLISDCGACEAIGKTSKQTNVETSKQTNVVDENKGQSGGRSVGDN